MRMTKTARKRLARVKRECAQKAQLCDQKTIPQVHRMVMPKKDAKAAKKTARHMRGEHAWKGGSRITMQSTAQMQWAGDYTKQLAAHDGPSFSASTGPTFVRHHAPIKWESRTGVK
jgi:hypothetical protein